MRGELRRLGLQFGRGHDAIDDASCSARSAEIGAPARHSSSVARARQAQQALAAAEAGDEAEVDFRLPTFAVSAAMRRWQLIASSSPPPRAKPLTIAITGLGIFSTKRIMRCPRSEKSRASTALMPAISAMSAPATKALGPLPVSTTTRTAGSAAAASKAACRARMVALSSAFRRSGGGSRGCGRRLVGDQQRGIGHVRRNSGNGGKVRNSRPRRRSEPRCQWRLSTAAGILIASSRGGLFRPVPEAHPYGGCSA